MSHLLFMIFFLSMSSVYALTLDSLLTSKEESGSAAYVLVEGRVEKRGDAGEATRFQTLYHLGGMNEYATLIETNESGPLLYRRGNMRGSTSMLDQLLFFQLSLRSDYLKSYLEGIAPPLVGDGSEINKEKANLFENYKSYLEKSKGGDSSLQIPSPLRPENKEERDQVTTLWRSPYQADSKFITLVKERSEFYWVLELPTLRLMAHRAQKRLKNIAWMVEQKRRTFEFYDYKKYENELSIPTLLSLELEEGEAYKISLLQIKYYPSEDGYKLFNEFAKRSSIGERVFYKTPFL